MATVDQEANTTDVACDDDLIVDPESLLDLEFYEEDEDEDDLNRNDIDQEEIELQV